MAAGRRIGRRYVPQRHRAAALVFRLAFTVLALALCSGSTLTVSAQSLHPDSLLEQSRWPHLRDIVPKTHAVRQAAGPIVVDGLLDEYGWSAVEWSDEFVDIIGTNGPSPLHRTRMKVIWDSTHIYFAADMEEPHLWGSITDSTRAVWHDNDFEVFIDPDGDNHDYFELEINALNTRNEVHFQRPYGDAGRSDRSAWVDGLQSRSHFRGTLNDRRDEDSVWTMEIAIPWSGFARYGTDGGPPSVGDVWRINFDRVNWNLLPDSTATGYIRNGPPRGHNWVFTPQGIVLMHVPEMWAYMQFRNDDAPAQTPSAFHMKARACLLEAYYRNRRFRRLSQRQATSIEELYGRIGPAPPCHDMVFEPGEEGFLISLHSDSTDESASIDHWRHLSFPAVDFITPNLRAESR